MDISNPPPPETYFDLPPSSLLLISFYKIFSLFAQVLRHDKLISCFMFTTLKALINNFEMK